MVNSNIEYTFFEKFRDNYYYIRAEDKSIDYYGWFLGYKKDDTIIKVGGDLKREQIFELEKKFQEYNRKKDI